MEWILFQYLKKQKNWLGVNEIMVFKNSKQRKAVVAKLKSGGRFYPLAPHHSYVGVEGEIKTSNFR